ncbi:MAG: CarD family transcriptional regulator [Cellulosilyticaceae bacterium]
MFEVGQVIFYTLRGTGIVQEIAPQTLLGEEKECMIVKMHFPEVVMRVPVDRIDKLGIREISNLDELAKVEDILGSEEVSCDYNMDIKMRIKENQQKLATGSFVLCSEVVRDLTRMEVIKSLNNMEKNILAQATNFLVTEVAVIKQIKLEKAKEEILNKIKCKKA